MSRPLALASMMIALASFACAPAPAEAAPPRSGGYLTDGAAPPATDIAPAGSAPIAVILAAAPGRRPVVVGLHGSNMLPEWSCGFVWEAFRGAANVVCPSGDKATIRPQSKGTHTFSWSGAAGAETRVNDALAAIASRFPDRVDMREPLLVTYSQSAYLAPAILANGQFKAGMIWEGFGALDAKTARTLPSDLRVALIPTSPAHEKAAEVEATALRRGGVTTYVEYPGNVGHGYAPEVRAAMRRAAPKLVSGLASWS